MEGGADGKRAESGDDFLREPFGGVGVDGAGSFACIGSCNFISSFAGPAIGNLEDVGRRAPYSPISISPREPVGLRLAGPQHGN